YYLLSLFPMLVIGLAIIPYLNIDPEQAVNFLKDTLRGDMADVFQNYFVNIINNPRGGLLEIRVVGALWSVSNAVHALISAINEAYEVEETRSFIFVRAVALVFAAGMMIVFIITMVFPVFGTLMLDFLKNFVDIDNTFSGVFQVLRWVFALLFISVFLFLLSSSIVFVASMIIVFFITMVFSVFSTLMLDFLKNFVDIDYTFSGVFQVLRWVFALLFISVFLFLLYRYAPNLNLPIAHVMPGTITVSILWQIITFGLYIYVKNFGAFSAIYGSVGVFIIIMVWFFLTGIILMVGAIINVMYHEYKQSEKTQ